MASCVSNVVSCRAGGDGLDDDWIEVLPPLCVLLEDLVGGGGGSQPSLRPPLKLNPLRLLGNGGRPCREDMAILSCMLEKNENFIRSTKIKESNGTSEETHSVIYSHSLFKTIARSWKSRKFTRRNTRSRFHRRPLAVAKRSFDCMDLDTVFGCSFERHCFARTATK